LLSDEEYRTLQLHLAAHPNSGAVIKGTGGLRKLRWSVAGRGKRGGARIIYYWAVSDNTILMLYGFPKNDTGGELKSGVFEG
jgi:mRNA-degrading endonuclease RelE of RelBE toxin-antitoxin system